MYLVYSIICNTSVANSKIPLTLGLLFARIDILSLTHLFFGRRLEQVQDNQEVIRKRGSPKGSKNYETEQEGKETIKKSKSLYMKNKEWVCIPCERSYSVAARTCHLRMKVHNRKALELKLDQQYRSATYTVSKENLWAIHGCLELPYLFGLAPRGAYQNLKF